ncbi:MULTISPECIES: hypothetical protein [unclassified Photorhabdus]|uniref:hypothetical protein n=1 Tax=unclassified Photorhabdus TaxID=2620880 RepID=UPI000DCD7BE0|nr:MULTISPECIES: hypothetical protein [unclassified Photorhabdus]RAX01479.1 hypothetical protein CKY03_06090 [Photorhabdus sp. S9-53]RAX02036.1 hypothetical protein CKY05_05330 [Photorhabdus sp. S10-54]RAX05170.1 hypothetical protein CKY04_06235 [Photorhabdus sp. S8-52]
MKHINFYSRLNNKPLSGNLIYRESEYSIDFIDYSPEEMEMLVGSQGCSSLTIGTLQIEVGIETGTLLYPWGLFSLTQCESKVLLQPEMHGGNIYINPNELGMLSGVAIEIPGSILWKVFRDTSTGWICIGNSDEVDSSVCVVQFATNAAISLKNKLIIALWIKPDLEP